MKENRTKKNIVSDNNEHAYNLNIIELHRCKYMNLYLSYIGHSSVQLIIFICTYRYSELS